MFNNVGTSDSNFEFSFSIPTFGNIRSFSGSAFAESFSSGVVVILNEQTETFHVSADTRVDRFDCNLTLQNCIELFRREG